MNRFLALLLCIISVPAYCSEKPTQQSKGTNDQSVLLKDKASNNMSLRSMPPINEESSIDDNTALLLYRAEVSKLIQKIPIEPNYKKIQTDLNAAMNNVKKEVSPKMAAELEKARDQISEILQKGHEDYHAQHKHEKTQKEMKKIKNNHSE